MTCNVPNGFLCKEQKVCQKFPLYNTQYTTHILLHTRDIHENFLPETTYWMEPLHPETCTSDHASTNTAGTPTNRPPPFTRAARNCFLACKELMWAHNAPASRVCFSARYGVVIGHFVPLLLQPHIAKISATVG